MEDLESVRKEMEENIKFVSQKLDVLFRENDAMRYALRVVCYPQRGTWEEKMTAEEAIAWAQNQVPRELIIET